MKSEDHWEKFTLVNRLVINLLFKEIALNPGTHPNKQMHHLSRQKTKLVYYYLALITGGGVCYYLTEWILAILAYTQSGYFTHSWDEAVNNTPTNTARRSGW